MSERLPRLLIIGLLSVLALPPRPALACSCGPPPTPEEAFSQAAAVFRGRVVGIAAIATTTTTGLAARRQREVTLLVDVVWKGPVARQIVLQTGRGGGDCGFSAQLGVEYLVYAFRWADAQTLGTGTCDATRPIGRAADYLGALGDGTPVGEATTPAPVPPAPPGSATPAAAGPVDPSLTCRYGRVEVVTPTAALPPGDAFAKADIVFRGPVVGIALGPPAPPSHLVITFGVERSWKGAAVGSTVRVLAFSPDGFNCDSFRLSLGDAFTVHGEQEPTARPDLYRLTRISRFDGVLDNPGVSGAGTPVAAAATPAVTRTVVSGTATLTTTSRTGASTPLVGGVPPQTAGVDGGDSVVRSWLLVFLGAGLVTALLVGARVWLQGRGQRQEG
ncbi:MAG: hypothetical protein M3Q65_09295 [Chloroflexota bacterium]|nr:hypothetical protein [Chloroflexota bacterium]